VEAHFTDGRSAIGDLLIGADGLHSVTREIIDPDAPKPRYIGINTVIGYTKEAISAPSPSKYRMFYGKRAFFGYITDPHGETWWFVRIPGPEIPKQALRETDAEEWRRSSAGFFTDDSIPAVEVISRPGPVFAINIYDLSSVRSWYGSSMVLIGDAVHALSPSAGQGASMAIEDSVVLAKCLRDVPNLATAFATYEGMRRDRVEQVLTTALAADPGAISWRRVIHRVLHDFKIAREETRGNHPHSWIYDYRLDWATTVNAN
jgi:2-polyprenyl-6-methoxyphenol hydroxylase-like FAD-dependent oxidoreductase